MHEEAIVWWSLRQSIAVSFVCLNADAHGAKVTFMELVVYTVFLPIFRRPEVGGKTRRNHRSFYETLSGVFDITPQMNNNS